MTLWKAWKEKIGKMHPKSKQHESFVNAESCYEHGQEKKYKKHLHVHLIRSC